MNIAIDGDRSFNTGWLTCFIGLPRVLPHGGALKAGDLSAWEEGWDTCNETPETGYPSRLTAFYEMRKRGQIVAFWIDDDGKEIEQ